MSEALRITTIQADLFWESTAKNLANFDQYFGQLESGQTDVVVLPEMFSTGFSMQPASLAEPWNNSPTLEWMKQHAASLDTAVCGSIISEDKGLYYNRFVFVRSDGIVSYYDKRHLFSLAGEHEVYTSGELRPIIEWRGWRICPQVCYDLRFPVFSRNTNQYDLMIYVANWPKPRIKAWNILLKARAIENQAYVIGVNRVGEDKNSNAYIGGTAVVDFQGEVLYRLMSIEGMATTVIKKDQLKAYRKRFPFLEDQDQFSIKN